MMESIKHNACLLKRGERSGKYWGIVDPSSFSSWKNLREIIAQQYKQLGHSREMRNSQSSFAENKWHPNSHISFCKCSKKIIITVKFCGSASDSVSYNNLGSKQYLECIFPVGVREERQK